MNRKDYLYLLTGYIVGAIFILAGAIPIGIILGLYENNYLLSLIKATLIYLFATIGVMLGIRLAEELEGG